MYYSALVSVSPTATLMRYSSVALEVVGLDEAVDATECGEASHSVLGEDGSSCCCTGCRVMGLMGLGAALMLAHLISLVYLSPSSVRTLVLPSSWSAFYLPFNLLPSPLPPSLLPPPVVVNFTASQARVCLDEVLGGAGLLLLGNSIQRGLFSLLNSFVNDWPLLSREQQKALCQRDADSGTYGRNCDFSQFQQRVPIYYDLMQNFCEDWAIPTITAEPRYHVVWVMVGTHPLSIAAGKWHREAHFATSCIPRLWGNWSAQPGHRLLYSTPPKPCWPDTIWGTETEEFLGQLHDAVYFYLQPAFRQVGADIIDFLNTTTTPGPSDCSHYGGDYIHPIPLYPVFLNAWLNRLCEAVQLREPLDGEVGLTSLVFNSSVAEAPQWTRALPP